MGIIQAWDKWQTNVNKCFSQCFTPDILFDPIERGDRFLEESLELVQTIPNYTKDRAHALVNYTFGRPVGKIDQEVGGVVACLAALCNAMNISIGKQAVLDQKRAWKNIAKIRAKHSTKPTGSKLVNTISDSDLIDKLAETIFPILWKREMYNGVTLDVEDYRLFGRYDMGGVVEQYEIQAKVISEKVLSLLKDRLI